MLASDASVWEAFDRAVHLLVDEGTLPKTDVVRTKSSGDWRRRQQSSKSVHGPVQRSPSTVSKVRTSNRSVASVRYSRTSFQASNSVAANVRAFRIDGCHVCQSFGMVSRWAYRDNVSPAAFGPHTR